MTKVNLGEFRVDVLGQDETIVEIKKELLKSSTPHILVTPNAGHLKSISTNKEIVKQAINEVLEDKMNEYQQDYSCND